MTNETGVLAEMQFGAEGQRETLYVTALATGAIRVAATDGYDHGDCDLTLGQAIQLRDFLNRHIDELALKQTGSLAQRASDDPTQLASIEEVPVRTRVAESKGCGRRFQYTPTHRLPCGEQSPFGPHNALCPDCRAQGLVMLAEQGVAVEVDASVLRFEETMDRPPAWNGPETQAPFNPARYKCKKD